MFKDGGYYEGDFWADEIDVSKRGGGSMLARFNMQKEKAGQGMHRPDACFPASRGLQPCTMRRT